MNTIYHELGLRPVINAAGTLTRLGGALMPPEVLAAMARAAEHCVRMEDLQQRAGELIAAATGAESGYVTCGAAAGLTLGAAACVAGLDIGRMERLPNTAGMKNEIIVQRPHRNSYDHALRAAGVTLVEVGWLGHPVPRPVQAWEIEAAINDCTAAIYWLDVPGGSANTASLAATVEVAHRHGVPVIVDASASLPPTSNLRAFTGTGADLVAFSGGKGLRGPQASGILAGRRDLIQSVALQQQDMDVFPATWSLRGQLLESGRLPGPPLQGIGRALKVGKEEIAGLLAALELFQRRDEAAEQAGWIRDVTVIRDALAGRAEVTAEIFHPPGRELPLLRVRWDETKRGVTGAALINALADGEPAVCLGGDGAGGQIMVNPFSLKTGEAAIVGQRLRALLA